MLPLLSVAFGAKDTVGGDGDGDVVAAGTISEREDELISVPANVVTSTVVTNVLVCAGAEKETSESLTFMVPPEEPMKGFLAPV